MQRLIIKLVLVLGLLTCPVSIAAQQFSILNQFTAAGTSTRKTIPQHLIAFSRMTWYLDGTITTCSFKMEKSLDGVTWTDLSSLEDCTSDGKVEFVTERINKFVRFNMTTLTGGGTVFLRWDGFKGHGCGIDYRGVFSVETSANPAAGAELSITVPSNEKWRVYSSSFELQASNVVEDREVFLTVADGSDEYFRVFADGVVKSGQKGIFTASALGFVGTAGLGPSSINQSTDVRTIMIPIYSDAFVPGGHTLATSTGGLQAGDDYGAAKVLVERCPN